MQNNNIKKGATRENSTLQTPLTTIPKGTIMYKITAIRKAFKPNSNIRLEYSWEQLSRFLVYPRAIKDKKQLPLWSPARFGSRTELTNEKVKHISLAVFDIDNGVPFESHLSFDNYQYIAHTSYSHTSKLHKWRLVIPFENPIPRYLWSYVWTKLYQLFKDITGHDIDISCKDSRRFYYLPCQGDNYKYFINDSGRTLSYDLELLDRDYRLQIEKEKKLREQRKREKERLADMPDYTRDFKREFIDDLRFEREKRMALGQRIGAKIVADRAIGFTCPNCGRKDATFFYLDPVLMWDSKTGEAYSVNHKAFCFHKESCGNGRARTWTLWGLARDMGVA